MSGRLLVCPTPIGNLEDVTLRVLAALRDADVVACEDTRRTRALLDRHGIKARLVPYHEHNERRRAGELIERIRRDETVALVSDAGTPLVSDPGYLLVREAVAAVIAVESLSGPSAVLAALVGCALPSDRWRFAGFLPRKRGELRALLGEAAETLVAFESPRRVASTLAELADIDPARPVALCRELTKMHEEIVRGTATELAARYRGTSPRGELVLVVGPSPSREEGATSVDGAAVEALTRLVEAGARPRAAAAALAELTGRSANALYRDWAATRSAPRQTSM